MNTETQIVKEWLLKFPATPSLTLAKAIYKDNKKIFKSVEDVRTIVRKLRGKLGKKGIKNPICQIESKYNPFDSLPKGLKSYSDFTPISIQGERILVLSDLHIPYHDLESLKLSLDFGVHNKVDTIILLGDVTDFYQASFWCKDPRARDLKSEIETTRKILEIIRQAFPKSKIYYKIGNHEERWERYLKVKAPEFYTLFSEGDVLSYNSIFETNKTKIEIIQDKKILKIKSLNLLHGHELYQTLTNPVNPARGLFLKGKELSLCGHYHQTSNHTENTMSGKILACWSIGCLCDLHPEYSPINKWNHGFAYIETKKDTFNVYNKKIVKGEIYNG